MCDSTRPSPQALPKTASPAAGEASADLTPSRPRAGRVLRAVLSVVLAGALVIWVLPVIGDTTWAEILGELGSLSPGRLLGLFGLLLTGLYVYALFLRGSLPGLGQRQAVIVNLAGSAVSNVAPAGGLIGVGATYLICRSWGFGRRDISTSVIVTAVWNFLFRMALPVAGMLALLTNVGDLPGAVVSGAVAGVVIGVALLAVFVAGLLSDGVAQGVGSAAGRVVGPLARRRGRTGTDVAQVLLDMRARMASVVRTGGVTMTVGLAGWFLFSFALFWQCLAAMGVSLPFGHLFAAFAVGRLLTAIPVTPGAVGVTEAGALAVLIAFGAPAPLATAGVVLFSIYTVLLVVPLGGVAWLLWWLLPRRRGAELT